jgi:hypothetical protein
MAVRKPEIPAVTYSAAGPGVEPNRVVGEDTAVPRRLDLERGGVP